MFDINVDVLKRPDHNINSFGIKNNQEIIETKKITINRPGNNLARFIEIF